MLMSASLGQLKCKRLIALHLRSTAPKKITCTNYVQVIFYARENGLERDVKKTAQCAVFSPRRVNRVSGAKVILYRAVDYSNNLVILYF